LPFGNSVFKPNLEVQVTKIFFSLVSSILIFASFSAASNYPSDMTMFTDPVKVVGPLSITRGMQYSGYTVLEIYYNGYLKDISSPIYLTAVAHYQKGDVTHTFKMQPRNGQFYVRLTKGCLIGKLGGCETWGTTEMQDLLYFADYYTRLNALDIDFAISNEMGQWDSNLDANYQFHFPQRNY
jgi:hypothetical protein